MSTLLQYQKGVRHLPRVLGWDMSGVIAPIVEADYRRLVDIFGLEPPGAPFTVYVEPGLHGAYHRSGDLTTFFIGAECPYGASVNAAAMVEVFAAAAGHGWDGGASNGAALTCALAVALHPEFGVLLRGTECCWWANGAVDYISATIADAHDPDANGCGLLFLSYMHDGLGQSWHAITRAGGATLAETYAALMSDDAGNAYHAFVQALRPCVDTNGHLVLPEHGNPWR